MISARAGGPAVAVATLLVPLCVLPAYRASPVLWVGMGLSWILPWSLAGLGRLRGWVPASTAIASLAAFAALATLLARPAGAGWAWLPGGLVDSWAEFVSVVPPVQASGAPLLVGLGIVWSCTAVSADLAVRVDRGAAALVPALAGIVAAQVVTSPRPLAPVAVAGVFLAAAAVTLTRRRDLVAAVSVLSVGVAAGLVAHVALSGRPPVDLSGRRPPAGAVTLASPLAFVAAQRSGPDGPVATYRSVSGQVPDRLVLATLSRWDGEGWQAGEELRPSSGVLAIPSGPGTEVIRGRVEIAAPAGEWLIHPGSVRRVDGPDRERLAMGADGSTVLAEVRKGQVWDITAEVTAHPAQVAAASRDEPAEVGAAGVLPADSTADSGSCRVGALGELAREWTLGAEGDLDRVKRLARYLTEGRARDETAGPGHSLLHVCDLVGLGGSGVPVDGRAEQYATALAVLGRTLGIPTRIVAGYRRVEVEGGEAGGISEWSITRHEADLWVDAWVGSGWIGVDPSPPRVGSTTPPGAAASPVGATPPPVPATTTPAATTAPGRIGSTTRGGDRAGRGVGWWLILVPLCALCLIPPVAKWLRRRGRRAAPARAAGMVVWAEWTDLLVDLGLGPGVGLGSSALVARGWDARPGMSRVSSSDDGTGTTRREFGDRLALLRFGPRRPDRLDAEGLWELEGRCRRELRRHLGVRRWWRMRCSWRSLLPGLRRAVRGEGGFAGGTPGTALRAAPPAPPGELTRG